MRELEKEIFEHMNKELDPSIKTALTPTQVMEITRCVSKWAQAKILAAAFDHAKTLAEKIQKKSGAEKDSVFDGEHDPDFLKELSNL